MSENSMKHFKAAQISGMEVSLKDLEKINGYALSKLEPADIFVFKVSMAGNEIDRDFEVFPRSTLVKLANLFVGKTVVKDHEHKSDNQIARIFATELVENDLARMTKTGEVFTQLIAKCYMVKTSKNADLIAEIQAGIRKEVSLGCRVDKAICSICGTDNVKTYCDHFPGRRYNNNQLCYFSLENASDAYELSFVAVPAQAHAGTVKSYGKKPCHEEEMMVRKKAIEDAREVLREGGIIANPFEKRLTVNQVEKSSGRLTPDEGETADVREDTPDSVPEKADGEAAQPEKGDEVDAKEMLKQLHDIARQLLVFQKSLMAEREDGEPAPAPAVEQDSEQAQDDAEPKPAAAEDDQPADGQTEAQAEEPSQEKASEPELDDQEGPSSEGNPDEGEPEESEQAADPEEAATKDKAAQARLRALDLALSLRKRSQ